MLKFARCFACSDRFIRIDKHMDLKLATWRSLSENGRGIANYGIEKNNERVKKENGEFEILNDPPLFEFILEGLKLKAGAY